VKDNVEPDAIAGSSKWPKFESSRSDTGGGTATGSDSGESDTTRDLSRTPSLNVRDTVSTDKEKRKGTERKRRLTVEEGCMALYIWAKKNAKEPVAALPLALVLYEPLAVMQSQTDKGAAFCQLLRGCQLVSREEWVSFGANTILF
jgi:hypothetical protein